jgi:predicted nucleic acid-binding protein
VILADTSIWVDHFRRSDTEMQSRLSKGQVVMHPLIVAELALGSLHHRHMRLSEMDALRQINVARLDEVRHMIETRSLYSKGIGLIDAHLIASCLMTPGTLLWTRDSAMQKVAGGLGIIIHLP